MTILDEIVKTRKENLRRLGPEMGYKVPEAREVPLNPFITDPFLICEIKRRSPSKGDISAGLNALDQAELYRSKGVRSLSILTEQDFFAGSLQDLMEVKKKFPDLSILRKDFLLNEEDIRVSYRAGADAILLIASILKEEELKAMYTLAKSLGLQPLVEVHTAEDVKKAESIKPDLTGINCRDLKRFTTDLTIPLKVKNLITWETSLLFESGIHSKEDARFALSGDFRGLLVGESVVKKPDLIEELFQAFKAPKKDFWKKLYSRKRPFVKICGITNREDALMAMDAGADILGFIFASSKRKAPLSLAEELKDLDILKIGVVVTDEQKEKALPEGVGPLLKAGLLDGIQFHGDETPDECAAMAFPYYKALSIKEEGDIKKMKTYHSPRVLVDAFSPKARGGTGHSIPGDLVEKIKEKHPLWLAGGNGLDNIKEVMDRFNPELIDASSKLEEKAGKKNAQLVRQFIKEIKSRGK